MPSHAIRKREYLTLLGQSQRKQKRRKTLIQTVDKEEILAISEIIDNLLRGNIPLSVDQRRKLKRHKTKLRTIAGRRVSIKRKRHLLQQSGGFLSAIIPLALSLLGGLISRR
jgi:hypothetical protein